GRYLNPRHTGVACMSRQMRPIEVKLIEPGFWKKTALGQHNIKRSAGMTFAQNESVSIGPVRTLGIHSKNPHVKYGQQLPHGKSRAYMRTASPINHAHGLHTNVPGELFRSVLFPILLFLHFQFPYTPFSEQTCLQRSGGLTQFSLEPRTQYKDPSPAA